MKRVVVVNGPNLNLLGTREPHIYGTRSLKDLEETVRAKAKSLDLEVSFYQSNHECEIIDLLQEHPPHSAGIVINPTALTHYSSALNNCLHALSRPIVEVHTSKIHASDQYRYKRV